MEISLLSHLNAYLERNELQNLPLIGYHIWRYKNRPQGMSGPGLYDPTNIMNSDTLSRSMKEGWIKLGVYLLSFFYYLYG
jgi:hypothetical protein